MTVSDRELQKWLRQIVLKPDAAADKSAVADSPRINDGSGAVWWNDGLSGEADPDGETDPDDPSGDDNDDGEDGKTEHDPSEVPKDGDDATGIGPLFDCNNPGKCINVRFNGIAKPPKGKETPCPPEGSSGDYEEPEYVYYWDAHAYWFSNDVKTRVNESGKFDSEGAAKGFVSGIIPSGQKNDGTPIPDFSNARGDDHAGGGRIISDAGYYKHEKWNPGDPSYFSFSIMRVECSIGNSGAKCKALREELRKKWENQNENWGGDECSEVVAKDGTFQPACPNLKDKNIPSMFDYAPTAFTLCDKDGNPVTVEPYGMGWKITTPTYEAVVNSDFKFQNVVRKI